MTQKGHGRHAKGRATRVTGAAGLLMLALPAGGCALFRSVLALDDSADRQRPIENPFGTLHAAREQGPQNIVLRSKKGDQSVEIELPRRASDNTEFVIPANPSWKETQRGPASVPGQLDGSYAEAKPTPADREITYTFPKGKPEDEYRRREIEKGLGLMPQADENPNDDASYLAAVDKVKQLYTLARYEAAVIEVDRLIRDYPTDPKLYEMRGTLLDRLGYDSLAVKSWEQALQFNPRNLSLQQFIDKKKRIMRQRGVASE